MTGSCIMTSLLKNECCSLKCSFVSCSCIDSFSESDGLCEQHLPQQSIGNVCQYVVGEVPSGQVVQSYCQHFKDHLGMGYHCLRVLRVSSLKTADKQEIPKPQLSYVRHSSPCMNNACTNPPIHSINQLKCCAVADISFSVWPPLAVVTNNFPYL